MSSDQKRPLHEAQYIATQAKNLMSQTDGALLVAGSVRRGMEKVGDIELVVVRGVQRVWNQLDTLLAAGTIQKASYGISGGTRWGDKYRGLSWRGWKIEVFAATPENFGYIYWLRTGPGDANQYVMQRLLAVGAPYRAKDGMWWEGDQMIEVSDEDTLFNSILGIPYLNPAERTLRAYQREMTRRGWQPGHSADRIKPLQPKLF